MDTFYALLFYIFLGVTFVNVAFYIFYWFFAFAKASQTSPHKLPPVSIIICAKNEAKNLSKNIPKFLAQEYPEFEIILINDASSDDTEEVMERFVRAHSLVKQVNVVNNEAFWGNKKYALTLGIKRAQYEHMLFTDADCWPSSRHWLKEMASSFSTQKEIVLGYGAYDRVKGSILNKLIRFETVITATQYFSWALAGRSYMGVGRNLGYTAPLFYKNKGFINHIKVQSGDDDLFVNEASTATNTAIQFTPDSFTVSTPKASFSAWITQKRRHISTASYYKPLEKVGLALFYSSQLFFFITSIILFISSYWLLWMALAVLIRYLVVWITIGLSASKLKERDLVILIPMYEMMLVCVQMSIFISNLITKPTRWK